MYRHTPNQPGSKMNEIQAAPTAVATKKFTTHDAEYNVLVAHMRATMVRRLAADGIVLFRTKTVLKGVHEIYQEHGWSLKLHGRHPGSGFKVDLNRVYLDSLADEVQYHTCSCCDRFLERFGDLVTIDADGEIHSALWDASTFPESNFYYPVVKNLQAVVERGQVSGVHRCADVTWGQFVKGGYTHFAVQPPLAVVHRTTLPSATRRRAELSRDYERMAQTFSTDRFSISQLKQLVRILDSNTLQGDEKIEGVGRWLYKTAVQRVNAKDSRIKANLLWRAIATAPAGFAHAETTMVGTVLEDLEKGLTFSDLRNKFGSKIRADVFQRPTAPPEEGAIVATEKIFKELGLYESVRRRVATFEDIPTHAFLWTWDPNALSADEQAVQDDVFSKLRARYKNNKRQELELPASSMSWNKFAAEILPSVTNIEIYVPALLDLFTGFTTAVVADSPPILKYDFEDARNPVSVYSRYTERDERTQQLHGVHPSEWNLEIAKYHQVTGLVTGPHQWGSAQLPNFNNQIYFIIQGAYDKYYEQGGKGLSIFPLLIKSELHSTLRVIEAISNEGQMEGDFAKQVAGLSIVQGGGANRRLRVQLGEELREIIIDRWE
jgi:hypothetical protein